jgi:thymidine phosphorylase
MHVRVGHRVERGQPLFSIHSGARGELDYALSYLARHEDVVRVEAR